MSESWRPFHQNYIRIDKVIQNLDSPKRAKRALAGRNIYNIRGYTQIPLIPYR